MTNIKKERDITYQNDLQHSYMVIKLEQSEEIIDYQVRIIQENPIEQLLPLYKKQMDEDIYFFYDITSKITLNQFLSRGKVVRHEFLSILKSMINGLKIGRQYLLQGGSFILDSDYIYINPATLELSVAYLPIVLDAEETVAVKALIMDLVIYKVSFESPMEGDFVYELLNLLKSEHFSLKQLDKLISSIAIKQEHDRMIRSNVQQLWAETENENIEILAKPVGGGFANNLVNKGFLTDTNHLIFVFIQLFFVVLAVLFIRFFYLQNKSLDISAIGGIAIIIAAIDVLVIKKLKLIEKLGPKVKNSSTLTKELNMDVVVKQRHKYLQNSGVMELAAMQEPLRHKDPRDFETRVLTENVPKVACLIGCGENKHEKIYIDKQSFTIGRIRNQCDFLSGNKAVGKLHAEIIVKDGIYYIKDLNTRNGTYINGERIVSNVEHSVHNNDRIAFADSEYEFHWS